MSYWKWLWNVIKGAMPDIQRPRSWLPPYWEYISGGLLMCTSLAAALAIHPYYCLLSVLGFLLMTHGWYRGHIAE